MNRRQFFKRIGFGAVAAGVGAALGKAKRLTGWTGCGDAACLGPGRSGHSGSFSGESEPRGIAYWADEKWGPRLS